jgi:membrane-associated phospholipid phosphatase
VVVQKYVGCGRGWVRNWSAAYGIILLAVGAAVNADTCTVAGPQVGQWKTWVLTSPSEVQPPAPPADDSAQTKAELEELRQLQKQRSDTNNIAVQFFNAAPATQRWTDITFMLLVKHGVSGSRPQFARVLGIVHTAMYDAMVATWRAKYTYNRKPPSQLAKDLVPAVTVANEPTPAEPSYPSEHAAIAAAAVGTLANLFPQEAQFLAAAAQEAGQTRLLAGLNYRSDVEAGSALGQAVAQKANARAATDGSDKVWTGTIPTGPGLWTGTDPQDPLTGTWKPWIVTSGSQLRPPPPVEFGSAQFLAELEEVKRLNANSTLAQRTVAQIWQGQGHSPFWSNAYALSARGRLSTPCVARILGVMGATILDAMIVNYDTKYFYWTIRPDQADPSIKAYVAEPPLPAYPAGAVVMGTSLAEVLGHFFPQEAPRLRSMAAEWGLTRILGGVHFRSDIVAAEEMGRRLAVLATERDHQMTTGG